MRSIRSPPSYPEQITVHALDVGDHAQIERLAQSLSWRIHRSAPQQCRYLYRPLIKMLSIISIMRPGYMHFLINTMAPLKMAQTFTPANRPKQSKNHRDHQQQDGQHCGQRQWRQLYVPVKQGGRKYGDQKSCHRPEISRNHCGGIASRMGKDRYGRPECIDLHDRKRIRHAACHQSTSPWLIPENSLLMMAS